MCARQYPSSSKAQLAEPKKFNPEEKLMKIVFLATITAGIAMGTVAAIAATI